MTTGNIVYCWGSNGSGAFGIGTENGPEQCEFSDCSTRPMRIASERAFGTVAASCAITKTNAAFCQLRTSEGTMELSTPRDRSGSFEPEIVKKRQTILADSLESKILGLYGLGMSLRDIAAHIKEMYDTDISHTVLSEVTDRVIPAIRLWQAHELEDVYTIVWLDAMYYKVKDQSGHVVTRCLYNVLGINLEGRKHLLGMYVSESEGSKFWLSVLTDLQQRGVKDILWRARGAWACRACQLILDSAR